MGLKDWIVEAVQAERLNFTSLTRFDRVVALAKLLALAIALAEALSDGPELVAHLQQLGRTRVRCSSCRPTRF